MSNPYNSTSIIKITSQEDFYLENLLKYKNLDNLTLNNININDITIINKLLENLDYSKLKNLNCEFKLKYGSRIKIFMIDNDIYLNIFNIKQSDNINLLALFNNLPNCINHIFIKPELYIDLNNYFINLPIFLKKINIDYSHLGTFFSVNQLNNGSLNYLFGIKLPFNCEINLHVQEFLFKVIYENNQQNELTLYNINCDDEKTKNIIIKFIDNIYNEHGYAKNNYTCRSLNILRLMNGLAGLSYSY